MLFVKRSVLLVALLLASPVLAQPSSNFADGFSDGLASELTVAVKLARDDGAKAILVNSKELESHGVNLPSSGSAALDQWAEKSFAWRPADATDIANGTAAALGIATHYHDWWHGKDHGSVTGDGRVVLVPDLVVRDAQGHETARYRVQVKGIPTGLRPVGVQPDGSHGSGLEDLYTALKEAIYSEALNRNGVPANHWVAVMSTPRDNHFTYPDGGVHDDPAGIFARSGDYLRIGHLNYVRDDKAKLRELIDHLNPDHLSYPDLWKHLTQLKVNETVDQFWARFFHGSITYDNIAFHEAMDFGTMSAVDRTHASSWRRTSPGFMNEASKIVRGMYAGELYDLMKKAGTRSDKQALKELAPTDLVDSMLENRMAQDALEHLGFSPSDARALMKSNRRDAIDFVKTFDSIGREKADGVTIRMGGDGGEEVKDPARYDLFGALSELVATAASGESNAAKEQRLVAAMKPLAGDATEHAAAARALLDAVEPLVTRDLAGLLGEVRAAKVHLIDAEAKRINESIIGLERWHVTEMTKDWVKRLEDGAAPERIRAEFNALVRGNVRRGPDSAPAVSDRIRNGLLRRPERQEVGQRRVQLRQGDDVRPLVAARDRRGRLVGAAQRPRPAEHARRVAPRRRAVAHERPHRQPRPADERRSRRHARRRRRKIAIRSSRRGAARASP
jgi:hypothetical protein